MRHVYLHVIAGQNAVTVCVQQREGFFQLEGKREGGGGFRWRRRCPKGGRASELSLLAWLNCDSESWSTIGGDEARCEGGAVNAWCRVAGEYGRLCA
jgi:hypothetical protein